MKIELFSITELGYTPETPRKDQPFTVSGKVELFGLSFILPVWVMATVEYPEQWWEELLPLIGAPRVREGGVIVGGDFQIVFKDGFQREGQYKLNVSVYVGPTMAVDSVTLPPFPPAISEDMTFVVIRGEGEAPPKKPPLEETDFRKFRIVSYSKNGGGGIIPPRVLELEQGDICRVNVEFEHRKTDVTGKFHAAIWQRRAWDPHDEVLNADRAFNIAATENWETFSGHIDIPITSDISPGEYGLYVKIMGITGGDIFSNYLENVIEIVGAPPESFFKFTKVVVDGNDIDLPDKDSDPGLLLPKRTTDSLQVTPYFRWIGPEKEAYISVYAGHRKPLGIFDPDSKEYRTELVLPYAPEDAPFNGRLTKPVTVPLTKSGGLHDGALQVVLKVKGMADYISTIWNIFSTKVETVKIETLEVWLDPVGAGYATVEPAPVSGNNRFTHKTKRQFEYGSVVQVEIHPQGDYIFDHWSGEVVGGVAYGETAEVLPMTEHRRVTAHFKKVRSETLRVIVTPSGAGTVDTNPEAIGGAPNNWLFPYGTRAYVTAIPASGYEFEKWTHEVVGGVAYGETAEVLPMTEHRSVTAHFKKVELQYSLEVTIEPPSGGEVYASPWPGPFSVGTKVALRAEAADGWKFDHWSIDYGREIKTSLSTTVTINKDLWVVAVFKKEVIEKSMLEVSIEPPGGGIVTASPPGVEIVGHYWTYEYDYNDVVKLTVRANPGYEFSHWSRDFKRVSGSKSISAFMTKSQWLVAAFRRL